MELKQPKIRWMTRKELPKILKIENQEFEYPWTKEDFIRCLKHRSCISMVYEEDGEIMGYMVYELHIARLEIINFVVTRQHQRKGVGTQMIEKLKSKLTAKRRRRLEMCVVETNREAQLFLSNQGFKAVAILDEFYDDCDRDAYLFQYNYINTEPLFTNRISQFYAV